MVKKTDPTNCQIWFAIQFTTNPLDDGDLKRLCHGRTKRFVPALVARAGRRCDDARGGSAVIAVIAVAAVPPDPERRGARYGYLVNFT